VAKSSAQLRQASTASRIALANAFRYDVLVLDAAFKQSLASIRSLGRAGLRVAAAESFAESDPRLPVAGFRSKYSALNQVLPSYTADSAAYSSAIVQFVREYPTPVVLPTMDGSIAAIMGVREQLADLGCSVALASNAALEIANSKERTLALARQMGISYPRTVVIDNIGDLPKLLTEFKFPFVLKPNISWASSAAVRLAPIEVVDESEAIATAEQFLAAGVSVLGQQWVSGRREGITLLITDGEVRASCAHATLRTTPALGGASVLRESIPIPTDIFDSSVRLVRAIGLDGPCEVEFRRDEHNRPFLMEVNARLAGTLTNAIHSGVDLPLLVWKWAARLPVDYVLSYRTGVRTRWLRGDVRWLRDNSVRVGRPDSLPRANALLTFAAEFARVRHYDSIHGLDLGPALGEMQIMRTAAGKARRASNSPT